MTDTQDTTEARDAALLGRLTTLRLNLALVAREAREHTGLTLEAAAERCGVTPEQAQNIETTAVAGVALEVIYQYLHGFGIDLHLVVSDKEDSVLVSDDEKLPTALQHLADGSDQPTAQERTQVEARAIGMATLYQILIEHAGAPASGVASFITAQLQGEQPCPEYRFQGTLGFGGKLYYDRARGFTATCYSEDLTEERKGILAATNRVLFTNGFNRDPRNAPEQA